MTRGLSLLLFAASEGLWCAVEDKVHRGHVGGIKSEASGKVSVLGALSESGVEWCVGVSGCVCHWVKGRVVFLESWGWWRERERVW